MLNFRLIFCFFLVFASFCLGDSAFVANESEVINQPVVESLASPDNTVKDSIYDNKTVGSSQLNSRGDVKEEKGGKEQEGQSLWRMFGSLLLVIFFIVLAAYFVKKFMPGGKISGNISAVKVLVRITIGPRQYLSVVRFGSRLLLVGVSPGHMTNLVSIDDPDEISRIMGLVESDSAESIVSGFSNMFKRESDQYEDIDIDDENADSFGQSNNELSVLLKKVKSLGKIKPKR